MKKAISIAIMCIVLVTGLSARANSSIYIGAGYGLGPVIGATNAFTHGISVSFGGEISVDEYADTIMIIEASGFFPIGAGFYTQGNTVTSAYAPSAIVDALIGAGGRFQIGNSFVTFMIGGGLYLDTLFGQNTGLSGTVIDFGIGVGLTADMRYEISDLIGLSIGIRPAVTFVDIRYSKSTTSQTLSAASMIGFSLTGRAVIAFKL